MVTLNFFFISEKFFAPAAFVSTINVGLAEFMDEKKNFFLVLIEFREKECFDENKLEIIY